MSYLKVVNQKIKLRGYFIALSNSILDVKQLADHKYQATCLGSGAKRYRTCIDLDHPKRSTCECPYANGNRLCNHMVGVYFKVDKAARVAYSKEVVEKLDSDVSSMYNDRFATTPTYAYPLIESYVNQLSEEECREKLKVFYGDHFISGYHQGLKDFLLSVIEKDK